MAQDVMRMISVVNVRKNWGKWITESSSRNKSSGPVRSPDWYAGRDEDQPPEQGERRGCVYRGTAHNHSVFLGSEAGVL